MVNDLNHPVTVCQYVLSVKLWVETHHKLIDQSYVHIICICSMHLPLLITTELANLLMNR